MIASVLLRPVLAFELLKQFAEGRTYALQFFEVINGKRGQSFFPLLRHVNLYPTAVGRIGFSHDDPETHQPIDEPDEQALGKLTVFKNFALSQCSKREDLEKTTESSSLVNRLSRSRLYQSRVCNIAI